MKIICLVENTSYSSLTPAHGLSIYVEANGLKILFDVGPDYDILKRNAGFFGINLCDIDYVVISHGHYDHGGALAKFTEENKKAKIFVNKYAFRKYYNITVNPPKYIGLDCRVRKNERIILTDGEFVPFPGALLFNVTGRSKCPSESNRVLMYGNSRDTFIHEQNLVVTEDGTSVLFCGCGHKGIATIMEKGAKYNPTAVFGGFHLMNPTTGQCVCDETLEKTAKELVKYETKSFYTCHCTGKEAFEFLNKKNPHVKYFSCGKSVEILKGEIYER